MSFYFILWVHVKHIPSHFHCLCFQCVSYGNVSKDQNL